MADAQIQVTESAMPALIAMGFRQTGLIAAGVTTIVGLVKSHNFPDILTYISSDSGNIFIAALATAAFAGYGWLKAIWDKATAVKLVNAVPDSVAVLK
ncbi:hypothetical protein D3Y57_09850 [Sphingomonas paeninsulae]|uniref:Holin n=1 Tax=Sphingomonas paeninsulae TaxID=2319844 RepID=A0A494TGY4_SPHPE|nr:hypothetical protein [Sphingomonas paeninsulae]AYJ86213.1 hypothetical protein D3Y57_09850 [Sphingomonas paeninsulae]